MVAVVNVANIASSSNSGGAPANFNVTCGSSDNILVVAEADYSNTNIASTAQNTSTGVWTTATQSWSAGQAVAMTTGGTPGGYSQNTVYYVLAANLTSTTAELATTPGGSVKIPTSSDATAQLCELGPPTAMTYNSVAMTLGSSFAFGGGSYTIAVSLWYLANPPTGSAHQVASTYLASPALSAIAAIPIAGVNTSTPFGTAANNSATGTSSPSLTVTGGASGDVYLACAINGIGTMTAAGANQTNLVPFNGLGGGANASISVDDVPGVNPGSFSWTGSGTLFVQSWAALGVAVKAATSSGAALASAATEGVTATGALSTRHIVADMVQESTATTGTSPFSLGGALTGFASFGSSMNDLDTCLYLAQAVTSGAPNGPWEIGIGTYTQSTNSLARTKVLRSSNSNSAVSFAAGTTLVSLTEPAECLWNRGVYNAGASGSSITIDWSNGPYQMVTLTANASITFANSMMCPHAVLELYQDATGSRVPTLVGAIYRSGSAPTWSTTRGVHDTLDVHYNSATGAVNVFAKT